MTTLHFQVLILSLSLVGALRISPVDTNSDPPAEVDLSSEFNDQHTTFSQGLSTNPDNFKCNYLPSDIPENLKDWEHLLRVGSGKKILISGDSMMKQVYVNIHCAFEVLGMYTEVKAQSFYADQSVTLVKRSEHDDTGLEIHLNSFHTFQVPHSGNGRGSTRSDSVMKTDEFCDVAHTYDYVFSNLGHDEFKKDSGVTSGSGASTNTSAFATKVKQIFENVKACGLANKHFSWVGHPVSHFSASNNQDGGYTGPGSDFRKCSCDQPNLEQQPTVWNSRYAKQLAGNFGFQYISVWEDLKDQCDKHPIDCQHYTVSPTVFAPIIRKITAAIQSSYSQTVDFSLAPIQDIDLFMENMVHSIYSGLQEVPMTSGDSEVLEQSNMRPELERKIFGSPKTYYFIGDSLMRNQFQSACLLLKEEYHTIEWPNATATFQDSLEWTAAQQAHAARQRRPPSQNMFTCTSGSVSFFFRWQVMPTPETVELMMKYGAPEPNVIYWDAALHVAHPATAGYYSDTNYPVSVQKTASLYAQAAPRANLVFFLSHAVCHKRNSARSDLLWRVCPREKVGHINDMASNVLEKVVSSHGKTWSFVDGFKLTENKCDKSPDGRHFNTELWNELSLLMNALNM